MTTNHHKYWIYQIIYKAKPIKFAIKLYTDHDTLWVKHATNQKVESLRAASPSNLGNMVSNAISFNTKYAKFSTKWYVLLHFHNPSALQAPLTLYSDITQQFFTSLFLRTTIPSIYTKNILPTSNILPIQAASKDQRVGSIVSANTVLISPFFLKVWTVIAELTHNH